MKRSSYLNLFDERIKRASEARAAREQKAPREQRDKRAEEMKKHVSKGKYFFALVDNHRVPVTGSTNRKDITAGTTPLTGGLETPVLSPVKEPNSPGEMEHFSRADSDGVVTGADGSVSGSATMGGLNRATMSKASSTGRRGAASRQPSYKKLAFICEDPRYKRQGVVLELQHMLNQYHKAQLGGIRSSKCVENLSREVLVSLPINTETRKLATYRGETFRPVEPSSPRSPLTGGSVTSTRTAFQRVAPHLTTPCAGADSSGFRLTQHSSPERDSPRPLALTAAVEGDGDTAASDSEGAGRQSAPRSPSLAAGRVGSYKLTKKDIRRLLEYRANFLEFSTETGMSTKKRGSITGTAGDSGIQEPPELIVPGRATAQNAAGSDDAKRKRLVELYIFQLLDRLQGGKYPHFVREVFRQSEIQKLVFACPGFGDEVSGDRVGGRALGPGEAGDSPLTFATPEQDFILKQKLHALQRNLFELVARSPDGFTMRTYLAALRETSQAVGGAGHVVADISADVAGVVPKKSLAEAFLRAHVIDANDYSSTPPHPAPRQTDPPHSVLARACANLNPRVLSELLTILKHPENGAAITKPGRDVTKSGEGGDKSFPLLRALEGNPKILALATLHVAQNMNPYVVETFFKAQWRKMYAFVYARSVHDSAVEHFIEQGNVILVRRSGGEIARENLGMVPAQAVEERLARENAILDKAFLSRGPNLREYLNAEEDFYGSVAPDMDSLAVHSSVFHVLAKNPTEQSVDVFLTEWKRIFLRFGPDAALGAWYIGAPSDQPETIVSAPRPAAQGIEAAIRAISKPVARNASALTFASASESGRETDSSASGGVGETGSLVSAESSEEELRKEQLKSARRALTRSFTDVRLRDMGYGDIVPLDNVVVNANKRVAQVITKHGVNCFDQLHDATANGSLFQRKQFRRALLDLATPYSSVEPLGVVQPPSMGDFGADELEDTEPATGDGEAMSASFVLTGFSSTASSPGRKGRLSSLRPVDMARRQSADTAESSSGDEGGSRGVGGEVIDIVPRRASIGGGLLEVLTEGREDGAELPGSDIRRCLVDCFVTVR